MNNQDKAFLPRRRLLEGRQLDKKPEKKKSKALKVLLSLTARFKKAENIENSSRKPFFHSRKRVVLTGIISLVVVAGGGAFGMYEWSQYQLSQNPAVIYAKKLKSITDIVGQQITLPKGEQPVVATVSDVTKLPKEAFFQNAQDGDKILMYKKHKEAILYRPTTGQVITEAVLDFQNATPTPAQQAVAGASTSASAVIIGVTPEAASSSSSSQTQYIPQGKILIQPQQ
jgi:hypothetical protein